MSPLRIRDVIAPERILPNLKAANDLRVIAALSRLVAAEAGIGEARVLLSVRATRRLTAFGVGRGVAIPHGVVDGLSAPLGAFARLKAPVDFGAADDRPVDLVFLIAGSRGQPARLLPLLARIARRLRDREVLKHLRAGCSPEAIYAVLATESWRLQVDPPRQDGASVAAKQPV